MTRSRIVATIICVLTALGAVLSVLDVAGIIQIELTTWELVEVLFTTPLFFLAAGLLWYGKRLGWVLMLGVVGYGVVEILVEFIVVGDVTLGLVGLGILLSAALLFQINHTDVRKHCGVASDEWFSQNRCQKLIRMVLFAAGTVSLAEFVLGWGLGVLVATVLLSRKLIRARRYMNQLQPTANRPTSR